MLSVPDVRTPLPASVLSAALLAAGCVGEIEDGVAGPGAGPGGRPGGAGAPLACAEPHVPVTPLTRLTRHQYDNTVRDLLGTSLTPGRSLPADDDTDGFEVGLTISPLLIEEYAGAAERLAEEAVSDLPGLLGCDPAADATCTDRFVERFLTRAYRRPPTAEERARHASLLAMGRDAYDLSTGVQMVVEAALQSPHFLYRAEWEGAGPGEDATPVTGYAAASRLSYFLWNTMPDDELFAAAGAGALDDPDDIAAQARRMMLHPNAVQGLRSFVRQWLGVAELDRISKDPALHPGFDAEVGRDLEASFLATFEDVVLDGDGRLDTLLLGEHAFVNARIAPLFGVEAELGEELVRLPLDGSRRRGILTHPALLSLLAKPNQSDPVHRGKFVRERLLCQNLPAPPDDIAIVAPDPAPGLTTRERFAEHSSNDTCRGCHQLMDPIGFGFEHYDATGAWRDTDQGAPVDASGEVLLADDADGPFDGAPQLAEQLAGSDLVRACVARQMMRFALRRVETAADGCSVDDVTAAFAQSGHDLRELMIAVTRTDAFLYQRVQR